MSPSLVQPVTSENESDSGWNSFLTCFAQHSKTCFTGTLIFFQLIFHRLLINKHQLIREPRIKMQIGFFGRG